MKRTNIHIANIIKEFGMEPTMTDVSNYCYKHYSSITGLSTSHRDHEGMFPEEMLEIVSWFESHFGYEYTEFESHFGN